MSRSKTNSKTAHRWKRKCRNALFSNNNRLGGKNRNFIGKLGITISVSFVLCVLLFPVVTTALDFSNTDQLTAIYESYNLPRCNPISYVMRLLGWMLVKGLNWILSAIESAVWSISGVFSQFYQSDAARTVMQRVTLIGVGLVVVVIAFLGFKSMLNQVHWSEVGQNILISIVVIVALPWLMSLGMDLTTAAMGFVSGGEDSSISSTILTDNVIDTLQYGFPDGGHDAENLYGTGKKDWNVTDVPYLTGSRFDVNELLDASSAPSGSNKEFILSHYLDGSGNVKEVATGEFWGIKIDIFSGQYYRFKISWFPIFASQIIMCVAFIFSGVKIARLLYELAINQVLATLSAWLDIHSGQRLKQCLQAILSTFITLVGVYFLFALYLAGQGWVSAQTFVADNAAADMVARLIIMLAMAWALIDGPNLFERLVGVDAGLHSGFRALLGARAAWNLAKGAAHGASSVGRGIFGRKTTLSDGTTARRGGLVGAAGAVGAKVAGAVGGAAGYASGRAQGQKPIAVNGRTVKGKKPTASVNEEQNVDKKAEVTSAFGTAREQANADAYTVTGREPGKEVSEAAAEETGKKSDSDSERLFDREMRSVSENAPVDVAATIGAEAVTAQATAEKISDREKSENIETASVQEKKDNETESIEGDKTSGAPNTAVLGTRDNAREDGPSTETTDKSLGGISENSGDRRIAFIDSESPQGGTAMTGTGDDVLREQQRLANKAIQNMGQQDSTKRVRQEAHEELQKSRSETSDMEHGVASATSASGVPSVSSSTSRSTQSEQKVPSISDYVKDRVRRTSVGGAITGVTDAARTGYTQGKNYAQTTAQRRVDKARTELGVQAQVAKFEGSMARYQKNQEYAQAMNERRAEIQARHEEQKSTKEAESAKRYLNRHDPDVKADLGSQAEPSDSVSSTVRPAVPTVILPTSEKEMPSEGHTIPAASRVSGSVQEISRQGETPVTPIASKQSEETRSSEKFTPMSAASPRVTSAASEPKIPSVTRSEITDTAPAVLPRDGVSAPSPGRYDAGFRPAVKEPTEQSVVSRQPQTQSSSTPVAPSTSQTGEQVSLLRSPAVTSHEVSHDNQSDRRTVSDNGISETVSKYHVTPQVERHYTDNARHESDRKSGDNRQPNYRKHSGRGKKGGKRK